MRRENFLEGVWLGGGEGKKMWWGLGVFLVELTKMFSPQIGEKTKGGSVIC